MIDSNVTAAAVLVMSQIVLPLVLVLEHDLPAIVLLVPQTRGSPALHHALIRHCALPAQIPGGVQYSTLLPSTCGVEATVHVALP